MPRQDADNYHCDHNSRHDEYSRKRLFHLRENDPECDVQQHDLDREPHLIVDQEYTEETADDRSEPEVRADPDIAQQCFGEIDVIADEERYEYGEDPSSHKALDIVVIRHPSLDESESRTEEEESDGEYSVVVEEFERSGVDTCISEDDNGLVEHDKDCQESPELLGGYPVKERCLIRRPAGYSCEQERSEKDDADYKCSR